jgi:hypothetical protein
VSANTLTNLYAIGAALLALWLLVRYPSLGPRKLRPAIVASAGAVLLEWPLLMTLETVRHSTGPGVALLLIGLPLLTSLFWTSGCLVRVLVDARRH